MSRGLTSRLRVATLAAEGASAKIRSLLASLSLPSRQQAPWANWGAHTSQWFTQIWSLRMTSKAPGNAYPHIYMISITEKTPEIGWLFHGFQKIIFHGMMITQSCSYGTINRQPESLTAILLGTGNANATPAAFPPHTSDMPTGSSTGQSIQTLQARLPVSTGANAFHSALWWSRSSKSPFLKPHTQFSSRFSVVFETGRL